MGERELLLVEIARCPLVESNICEDRQAHPCHGVVTYQWPNLDARQRCDRWKKEHHVPEPWAGHIEEAPLLFLSSNPSVASLRPPIAPRPEEFAPPIERIGDHHVAQHSAFRHGLASPKPIWTDAELVDRYSNAFDVWMVNGTHGVADESGSRGKRISYWADVRPIAEALFDRAVVPGHDYAITEVVHCKSKREVGAGSAVSVCAPLYLERVLALSPASLVVVFGSIARNAVRQVFAYPDPGRLSPELKIAGRKRRLVFLAHPNARKWRPEYPKQLPREELLEARLSLARSSTPVKSH